MPALVDFAKLRSLDRQHFEATQPYPWACFDGLLTPSAFTTLLSTFPALDRFERHQDRPRASGQRPHNRYYLAYESSIYDRPDRASGSGTVYHHQLPEPWRCFLDTLRSPEYLDPVAHLLGVDRPTVRFAWHVGVTGSEVSPHRDARRKAGTHIFYFNTRDDWDPSWGGAPLILGEPTVDDASPDFGDFSTRQPVPFLDNRSLLFRRTPDSWHGVEALTCPEGQHRRLFNVIFEHTA